MNCPLADHLLVDGVLVENPSLVKFIQKCVADFRPQEKVCRECIGSIEPVFHQKRERAKALAKSRYGATISTLQSSSSSGSQKSIDSIDLAVQQTPQHLKLKKKQTNQTTLQSLNSRSLSQTFSGGSSSGVLVPCTPMRSIENIFCESLMAKSSLKHMNSKKTTNGTIAGTISVSSSSSSSASPTTVIPNSGNTRFSQERASLSAATAVPAPQTLAPPSTAQASAAQASTAQASTAQTSTAQTSTAQTSTAQTSAAPSTFVNVRKRTILDFLQPKAPTSNNTNSNGIRVDSEVPTTSKAAAAAASAASASTSTTTTTSRKRPAMHLIDSDSDVEETALSLNAYNGTYMPNVQPIPPARRPRTDLTPAQIAMENYAKNITGG